jgi:hypothetical protein
MTLASAKPQDRDYKLSDGGALYLVKRQRPKVLVLP